MSDYMQAEYSRRYGYDFRVFTNGVDPAEWPDSPIDVRSTDQPFRLLYIGSVSANTNLTSLQDFCDLASALGRAGERIQLTIAGSVDQAFAASLVQPPTRRLESSIPHQKMQERLRETDLLVLPFNFDRGSHRFIRYSWPTKLPEYMISGRPVLMYGPSDTAFGQYAVREKWAYFVGTRDLVALRTSVLHLMRDRDLREGLARVARNLAIRHHNINTIRGEFQSALCRLSRSRCVD